MKKLLLLFLIPISAFAQNNIRWDLTAQTVTGHGQMVPVLALPGAFINFYINCTNLPCTTPATTYISASSSSTCASSTQVVWQLPLPQACTAQADSQGNFGGYFQPGAYQYTITVSGHVNGPYQFNVGSGASGGSGGCSVGGIPTTGGIVNGDVTSTNCGTNNRVSDTATSPADVQTFGYTNLATNSVPFVVAVGNNQGVGNDGQESIFVGDHNWGNETPGGAGATKNNNIGIGNDNLDTISGSIANMICIGDQNCKTAQWGDEIVAIGNNNFVNNTGGSQINNNSADVFIGLSNGLGLGVSDDDVGIGDNTCNGNPAGGGGYSEITCIGNNAGGWMEQFVNNGIIIGDGAAPYVAASTADFIVLGDGAGHQCDNHLGACTAAHFPVAATFNDTQLIGDRAGTYNAGSNNVAIGSFAIGPSDTMALTNGSNIHNTGTFLVAVGDYALGANTTGSNNVAVGPYAGADGFAYPNTIGNSNKTGANNTWIGYDSGPNTTSQLTNTIALGYQAHVGASNSVTIGNSSMTGGLTLYGCAAGKAPFGDGSGCFTPVVSPLTTKGDIWVFSSADTRLPVGTNGQVLSANSAQTTGLQWISALTNPMNTLGDIIYGGAAGAATRLGGNTTGVTQCLLSTGSGGLATAPVWGSCAGSAATALSSVTAAVGANTIASGNNGAQVWNWAQTTNSQTAFTFGETSAATGTNDIELAVTTNAGSTAIPLAVTGSINGTQTIPALQVTPTWNTSGVVDAGILENVTNTASGAASKLLDLQVGGVSQMAVDKTGSITNATWNGVAIANAKLANSSTTVNTQTCTLGSTCTVTANTTNALTMNNGGAGAGSGTTFNGNAAVTLSYNTLGAAPTASPTFTGSVTLPVTGSTQCLQVNSSGVIGGTGAACGSGGGGGFAGTVTYTTSHTLSATGSQCAVGGNDNGCLIIMNCSSACALTLPNPQPTSTMLVGVISKGSSIATITLGSSMTYNGGLTPPVLLSNSQISVASNSSVSTDYVGTTPIKAGSGVTITSSTANQTVVASGSTSTVGSAEVVAFSATPTFSASFNVSRIVLSGNITSFTMAGASSDGQLKTLCFEQGSGAYTVAAPANVHGFFTVGNISTDWNCQSFAWDNTDSIWLATSAGVINQ